jgi:uncharacterized protein YqgV (UPF0045/DUF77 family)
MFRLEFTIEPFVEGQPGRHVTAAIDAVVAHGVRVEIGPFGSSCLLDEGRVGEIVGILTTAAVGNGATHVSLNVERADA